MTNSDAVGSQHPLPRRRFRLCRSIILALFGLLPPLGLLAVMAPSVYVAVASLFTMQHGQPRVGLSLLWGIMLVAWTMGCIAFVHGAMLVIRIMRLGREHASVRPQERRWVKRGLGLWIVVLGFMSL